ncbi:MAG: hypothetical protein WD716_02700 [Fimbriimonadaceae bacterium]
MRNWFIGGGAVAVTALTVLFVATAPSDEDLIRQAIEESSKASSEGKPGGVLDYIDSAFLFNNTPAFDRNEIAKVVRLAKPEVEFSSFAPQIEGDEATVVADVKLKLDYLSFNIDRTVPGVEVRLRKTTGTRWLVFPGTKWKITEISAPELAQYSSGAF